MAVLYKVLGQLVSAPTSRVAAYRVPADRSAVVLSLVVCNRHSSLASTFRISVAVRDAPEHVGQFLYYDTLLDSRDTFVAELNLSLAARDVVYVQSNTGNLTFSLFGKEIQ